jgi:hypothetical protein
MSRTAWRYGAVMMVAFLAAVVCSAQPGGGGPGGGAEPVPLSGVEWLLLAGSALGAKKIYQKINKRTRP